MSSNKHLHKVAFLHGSYPIREQTNQPSLRKTASWFGGSGFN